MAPAVTGHSTGSLLYDRFTFETGRLLIRDGGPESMIGLARGELAVCAHNGRSPHYEDSRSTYEVIQ